MIARRHELARLLGFELVGRLRAWPTRWWAPRPTRPRSSTGSSTASGDAAEREYQTLLRRKRQDVPGATAINRWETGYLRELVRRSDYDFDSQQVRPYFPYDAGEAGRARPLGPPLRRDLPADEGRAGVAPVGRRLGDAGGRQAGRALLSRHASRGRASTRTRPTSESAPARPTARCPSRRWSATSPAATPGEPGLMDHGDVETFLHEFGHLMHSLLARQRWNGISGVRTEWDFVEAPSQMLEEWSWDPTGPGWVRAALRDRRADSRRRWSSQLKRATRFGRATRRAHPDDLRPDLALAVRPPPGEGEHRLDRRDGDPGLLAGRRRCRTPTCRRRSPT